MSVPILNLLQKDVILDACSVYALYATGEFDAILSWIPGQVYLASYVEKVEVKELYNPKTGDFDIPVDLSGVKNTGLLMITKPHPGVEAQDTINFANAMGTKRPGKNTGEAICGAIAKSRDWAMITDDVDGAEYLTKQGLGSNLTTTLHVIECWASSSGIDPKSVKHYLELIRLHARYGPPPKTHPLLAWWLSFNIQH